MFVQCLGVIVCLITSYVALYLRNKVTHRPILVTALGRADTAYWDDCRTEYVPIGRRLHGWHISMGDCGGLADCESSVQRA